MLNKLLQTFAIVLFVAPLVQAGERQTDWIQPVTGHKESTLGASVRSVETDEAGEARVTIAIPKPATENSSGMEEVVVVGRRADDTEEEIEVRHEWVKDYDNDNYGLILYLGKNGNLPLRLQLKTNE